MKGGEQILRQHERHIGGLWSRADKFAESARFVEAVNAEIAAIRAEARQEAAQAAIDSLCRFDGWWVLVANCRPAEMEQRAVLEIGRVLNEIGRQIEKTMRPPSPQDEYARWLEKAHGLNAQGRGSAPEGL